MTVPFLLLGVKLDQFSARVYAMLAIFGAALFALASAGILWLSWRSLRSSKVHGFYRFFAFENLALLISVNLPIWFRDPWCARQMCSYAFGALSIALAVEGFRLLRRIGRPSASVSQGTNLAFENTTRLVICGGGTSQRMTRGYFQG